MNVDYDLLPAFDAKKGLDMHLRYLLELSNPSTEEYPASFDLTNTYWTSTEKTTFFASVARNSRWRPDLISEDLGHKKTVGDVCSYINLLEQVLSQTPHTDRNVAFHPVAHEVSMDWIAIEEELAGQLNAKDLKLHGYILKTKHDKEIKAVKRSFPEDDGEIGEKDGMSWKERLYVRKQEVVHSCKREDFLISLDRKHLRGMDAIIKTQEDADIQGRLECCNNKNPNVEMRLGSGNQPEIPITEKACTSIHHAGNLPPLHPLPDDYSQINPSLLAPDVTTESTKNPISTSTRRLPTDEILANLSPVSRRRLRKRLWTRRKRAMESGFSAPEASTEIGQFKHGQKSKHQNEEYEAKALVDHFNQVNGAAPISPEALDNTTTVHWRDEESANKSTEPLASVQKKRPYGWARLQGLGIDATALRAGGLDIFHLEKVARLASLFQDVHALSSDCSDKQHQPGISYNLLRLLRACMVHFITRVIAHAIVHKDKKKRQKWRIRKAYQSDGPNEIRPESVHEALVFLGEAESGKAIFQRLSRMVRTAAAQRRQTGDEELEEFPCSDKETEEDNPEIISKEAIDASLYPDVPFVIENSADKAAFYWVSNRYDRKGEETTETQVEDINELALQKELKADALLDESDRRVDSQYESGLWAEVGMEVNLASQMVNKENQLPRQQEDHSHTAEGKPWQSFIHEKRGATVRSRQYIDSDEDI